jgi:copper chaperone
MEQVTLKVNGMTCGGCVRGVRKVLERVPGVVSAEVSLDRAEAQVTFDAARVDPQQLTAAVEAAGYQAAVPA